MEIKESKTTDFPPEQGLFGPLETIKGSSLTVSSDNAQLVRVAFEDSGGTLFDYALPESLRGSVAPGQRVRVPFGSGNRLKTAFCVDLPVKTSVQKVKIVYEVVDPAPLLDSQMMKMGQWIAQYYCCSLGTVLSAMVPAAVKRQVGLVKRSYVRLTEKGQSYCHEDMTTLRLSSKGKAIISYLQSLLYSAQSPGGSQIEPIALDELTGKMQCGKGPFATLERLGLIEISQKREIAKPTSQLDFPSEANEFELNDEQISAISQIEKLTAQGHFNAVLLHGVTGSGKTEVYIRCIEKVLAKGMSALVLVPEIALTPQTQSRFLSKFHHVAVLHSAMSSTQRHQQWRSIASGQAQVVVGARSAVFAPLPRLGLIVVDEEHEPSYKQDNSPRYHGRDVAVKRAQMLGITVILGSATPSLETMRNCQTKKHYYKIPLPKRVLNLPLPRVTVIDMRTEMMERRGNHILSRLLESELRNCVQAKRQAILLLNRRGHSNYVFCPSCQFTLTCPNCDVSLTYHKRKKEFESSGASMLMCHYCLHRSRVPRACPLCAKKMILIGPGTQKAEEEIKRKLPDIRMERVDSDSMRSGNYVKVLADFGAGKIDVLMGTQMIGKGLDFPNVSLVGVLNADTALSVPDFRSSERTFQLISQVAGRCGRASDDGRVIVQSYMPDEPAVALACRHDYQQFARDEMLVRQHCSMPPYHRLARFILRDINLKKTESAAKQLRQAIDTTIKQLNLSIAVHGPMPAGIARMENLHRQEILLRAPTAQPIQQLLTQLRNDHLPSMNVLTAVDVDPISMM